MFDAILPSAESSCCSGSPPNPKPPKPVKEKKEKPKKEKPEKKPKKEKGGAPAEGTAADAKEKDPKSSGKEKKDEKAKPVPVQVKHTTFISAIFFDIFFSFFVFCFVYHFIHKLFAILNFAHHNAFVSKFPHIHNISNLIDTIFYLVQIAHFITNPNKKCLIFGDGNSFIECLCARDDDD